MRRNTHGAQPRNRRFSRALNVATWQQSAGCPSLILLCSLSFYFFVTMLLDCPFAPFVHLALWGVTGLWPQLWVEVERLMITGQKAQRNCCTSTGATKKPSRLEHLNHGNNKKLQMCYEVKVQEVSESVAEYPCVFIPIFFSLWEVYEDILI